MARPPKCRCVQIDPEITYFKPRAVPLCRLKEVTLELDELEALRLKELQNLDQKKCARKMGVSQTTFQRILHQAHRKITEALISGKAIAIKTRKEVSNMAIRTPKPGPGRSPGRGRQPRGYGLGPGGNCICPSCETTVPHKRGIPCYEEECPKCGARMTRER